MFVYLLTDGNVRVTAQYHPNVPRPRSVVEQATILEVARPDVRVRQVEIVQVAVQKPRLRLGASIDSRSTR